MKIIYMGTPEFAVAPLEKLIESGHEIVCAITQPDKPKNRGKKLQPTPVKEAALRHGIPVLQPERVKKNEALLAQLQAFEPDLGVVAAYGKMLPVPLLELPRYGCINIHASLLPKLRGAAPIQRAIMEDFRVTGVTIMQMAEGMDTGDMLGEAELVIGDRNASQLHDALSALGAELLSEILPEIEEGTVVRIPQEDSLATYAPMITKETGLVDFSNSARLIQCQIRAMDPWPSAYCYYEGIPIKLKESQELLETSQATPGMILSVGKEGMKVACKDRCLLIKKIQFPNKKAMSVEEYIRGNEIKTGVILRMEE